MKQPAISLIVLGCCISASASATPISAIDFDTLDVGAKISGPVGPDVEVSLLRANGDSVGDLRSSVSCPSGFTTCAPPGNAAGTIYTYSHTVTPGIDNPNDPPFPGAETVVTLDDVAGFRLAFEASGFNGVAGYGFSEAGTAGVEFSIEQNDLGELAWITNGDDWDTGEAITFFWQTTQAPTGPGGVYSISNSVDSGSGAGPVPARVPPATTIPEPLTVLLLLTGLAGFSSRRVV